MDKTYKLFLNWFTSIVLGHSKHYLLFSKSQAELAGSMLLGSKGSIPILTTRIENWPANVDSDSPVEKWQSRLVSLRQLSLLQSILRMYEKPVSESIKLEIALSLLLVKSGYFQPVVFLVSVTYCNTNIAFTLK